MENGEIKAVMEFVASDDDQFDVSEFLKHWPAKVEDQRKIGVLISIRNARELKRVLATVNKTRITAIFALGIASYSLSSVLGLESEQSILAGGLSTLVGWAITRVVS
jgi:hypothetical protein